MLTNLSRQFLTVDNFSHRAFAAFLALAERCSSVSFSALAYPPILPTSCFVGFDIFV